MNETDLSDEAFYEYAKTRNCEYTLDIWQECRRRAQIQLEKERREAFKAGLLKGLGCATTNDEHIEAAYRAFLQEREGK